MLCVLWMADNKGKGYGPTVLITYLSQHFDHQLLPPLDLGVRMIFETIEQLSVKPRASGSTPGSFWPHDKMFLDKTLKPIIALSFTAAVETSVNKVCHFHIICM